MARLESLQTEQEVLLQGMRQLLAERAVGLCLDVLFLSKLLPLLVYPLGVALLLLLAALILLWQRPRWAATAIVTCRSHFGD